MSDVDIAEDTVQDVETETAQEVAEPAGAELLPRDLVEAADALNSLVATPR